MFLSLVVSRRQIIRLQLSWPQVFSAQHLSLQIILRFCSHECNVVGVVTMTWFSVANWKDPLTLYNILFHSTLADSLILMGKLPLAHSILLAWREFDAGEGA